MSDSTARPAPADALDPAVTAIIRRKARRLIGCAGLRPQDREDLEHQLSAHVLERLGRFDPARGTWPAFAHRLVERFGHNLVRALRTAKRSAGPLTHLTEEAVGGAGEPSELDLADALAHLPEDLRAVAELLVSHTVVGVARELGVSRATVHARVRELRGRREIRDLLPDP